MSRIVAIESDPARARRLRALVHEWTGADVLVTASAAAALDAMAAALPDLILVSTLLQPSDDARLMEWIREQPAGAEVPVLTVPPLVDVDLAPAVQKRQGVLSFFGGRPAPMWPHYDGAVLGQRIREALEDSMRARLMRRGEAAAPAEFTAACGAERVMSAHAGPRLWREPLLRAPRLTGLDIEWLSGVKLAWGLEVQLLNISTSGMLIESGTRFSDGASAEFELFGARRSLLAPARFVRTRVARADGPGVRYQTAAAFDRDIPILDGYRGCHDAAGPPPALSEVLAWVKGEAERGTDRAILRAAYELEVQHLVTARDVRICAAPALEPGSGDSVFFAVPADGNPDAMLCATFEPGHKPGSGELELLRMAAAMAPEVLASALR